MSGLNSRTLVFSCILFITTRIVILKEGPDSIPVSVKMGRTVLHNKLFSMLHMQLKTTKVLLKLYDLSLVSGQLYWFAATTISNILKDRKTAQKNSYRSLNSPSILVPTSFSEVATWSHQTRKNRSRTVWKVQFS